MAGYSESTLCWKCQNAYANKCVKFKGGVIEGWEIKECLIDYGGSFKKSYGVVKCPNFIPDAPRDKTEVAEPPEFGKLDAYRLIEHIKRTHRG